MSDQKKLSCFVIMPYGARGEYGGAVDEADTVYNDIICPALNQELIEADIHREVDDNKPGAVNRSMITRIAECDLAIVDITGQNPNVFLELGVRYALRRSITIVMKQKSTPIPFDINSFRCVEYSPFRKQEAIVRLRDAIAAARGALPDHTDSLVFEFLPALRVDFSSPNKDHHPMPWRINVL